MNEVKISGIVVCFNEERDIRRCIASMQEVCDEVVVVDSFSTDKTPEICKEMGVAFFQNPFEGYIEQKVFAASLAKNDVLLSLDADEQLSDQLIKSILTVKNNWNANGYLLNRLTNYCGKWIRFSGWYPDRKLRLFEYSKGKWGGTNPHDKVILDKGSKTDKLHGDIFHFGYYTYKEHLDQVHNFSNIASQALYDKGVRSGVLKIIYKPIARFLKSYIFKLGVLDGKNGFTIARMTAYSSYLKYTKLRSLQINNK
jgi:glycosyltransferase involved in cell wall biosynthesis